jgi:hypothetical protein
MNATAHITNGKDAFPSMAIPASGNPTLSRFLSTESAPEETIVRFQKPQVIEWSHELSNKVSLMGTLVNGVDIQYLDCGKTVARCSIKVKCPPKLGHKEDFCWYFSFLLILGTRRGSCIENLTLILTDMCNAYAVFVVLRCLSELHLVVC